MTKVTRKVAEKNKFEYNKYINPLDFIKMSVKSGVNVHYNKTDIHTFNHNEMIKQNLKSNYIILKVKQRFSVKMRY